MAATEHNQPNQIKEWLDTLFKAIDTGDTALFIEQIHPDCQFRFGNAPVICGHQPIADFFTVFMQQIAGIKHTINAWWDTPSHSICHGTVCYTRLDQSQLTIPFANIMQIEQGKIREYLIFADSSQLFHT